LYLYTYIRSRTKRANKTDRVEFSVGRSKFRICDFAKRCARSNRISHITHFSRFKNCTSACGKLQVVSSVEELHVYTHEIRHYVPAYHYARARVSLGAWSGFRVAPSQQISGLPAPAIYFFLDFLITFRIITSCLHFDQFVKLIWSRREIDTYGIAEIIGAPCSDSGIWTSYQILHGPF